MCLIAFAIGASERWPLVIAANRDEFFDRPTLALARWTTAGGHNVISGRDLQAGGTWLGLSNTGLVAMLTNVRELPQAARTPVRSRGDLVMRWLESEDADADALTSQIDPADYGGCNLIIGDLRTRVWFYLSNRTFTAADTGEVSARPRVSDWNKRVLGNGVYALGNAALDTPWPKALRLKAALTNALYSSTEVELAAHLWKGLGNRDKATAAELPDTGLPTELEAALSSAFISEAGSVSRAPYGTRCSTVLIAQQTHKVSTFLPATDWTVDIDELIHAGPGSDESVLPTLHSSVRLTI